jgi:hypothetical protein
MGEDGRAVALHPNEPRCSELRRLLKKIVTPEPG